MTIEAEADIRRKEAAEWFSRLNQRKVTTADVREFSEWRRDPENARAFKRVEAMWDAAGMLAASPEMAVATQEAASRSDQKHTRVRASGSGRLMPLGAAGAVAVALCIGGWFWFYQRPQTYSTVVGERTSIALEDGSQILLDTNSRVTVRYSASSRLVTLASGQAMFDVNGDKTRPFLVKAGDTEVTALGTRFDVRLAGSGARVILVEGRVAVRQPSERGAGWSLTPGQQVVTSNPNPAVIEADVPASTSWTTGRLTFENTPIAVAVAEVNRYSHSQIQVEDDRLSSVRVSGVFNAGDVDGFVAALSDLYALEATRSSDGRLVLTGPA